MRSIVRTFSLPPDQSKLVDALAVEYGGFSAALQAVLRHFAASHPLDGLDVVAPDDPCTIDEIENDATA